MAPNPKPAPVPVPVNDAIPRYSASEVPVSRSHRIAFQVWVVCVLLSLALTLVFYLIDKLSPAVKN